MGQQLINLDALRAPSHRVKFLEREWELGYLPAAVEIPLLERYQAMVREQQQAEKEGRKLPPEKLAADNIALAAQFCGYFYPEVTAEVIAEQATGRQVLAMIQLIVAALVSNNELKPSKETAAKKKPTGPKSSMRWRWPMVRQKPTS